MPGPLGSSFSAAVISIFGRRERRRGNALGPAGRERSQRIERAVSEALESRRLLSGYAFSVLANVPGSITPTDGVIVDSAGNLFGAGNGGANGDGAVFEVAKGSSTATTLASLTDANGLEPVGRLLIDSAGNLYGTASGGVFELARGATTITTIAPFNGTNGNNPQSGLIEDSSGNLYGTTLEGGTDDSGTVFELAKGATTITVLANANGINHCEQSGFRSGHGLCRQPLRHLL